MRRMIAFPCAGETLIGTLDDADGATGLLIVSGGNELRCGAHRGMALLAGELAGRGVPVFRYDRRGIGDSGGTNRGYASGGLDLTAAAAAFRTACPQVTRIVATGNCDGATMLALFHREAGIERLVLTNPWVGDEPDALPPATAIRRHYAARLRDPRQWLRLAIGRVDLGKLFWGLRKTAVKPLKTDNSIAIAMRDGLGTTPTFILLASGDATAIRYARDWGEDARIAHRASDSHSFARTGDAEWLRDRILAALD